MNDYTVWIAIGVFALGWLLGDIFAGQQRQVCEECGRWREQGDPKP